MWTDQFQNALSSFVSDVAVRQLLGFEGDFRCVLADDGCEIVIEVLETIIVSNEKIGVIMVLRGGENWTRGEITCTFDYCQ